MANYDELSNKLKYLCEISDKISINQLINVLINHDFKVEDIKFLPVFDYSSSGASIINIYNKRSNIYIEINIFRIRVFSELEELIERYQCYDNENYFNVMKYGIHSLLPTQIFVNGNIQELAKNNFYNLTHEPIISKVIYKLYKEFREDYCIIIDYDRVVNKTLIQSNTIGKDYINNIHLGGYSFTNFYTLNINIILSSEKNIAASVIDVKKRSYSIIANIKLLNIKVDISATSTDKTDRAKISYIGNYYL